MGSEAHKHAERQHRQLVEADLPMAQRPEHREAIRDAGLAWLRHHLRLDSEPCDRTEMEHRWHRMHSSWLGATLCFKVDGVTVHPRDSASIEVRRDAVTIYDYLPGANDAEGGRRVTLIRWKPDELLDQLAGDQEALF